LTHIRHPPNTHAIHALHDEPKLTQPPPRSGLVTFGGGLPIKDSQGRMLGAIGVSGGSVEEDIKVAQAGLDSLK